MAATFSSQSWCSLPSAHPLQPMRTAGGALGSLQQTFIVGQLLVIEGVDVMAVAVLVVRGTAEALPAAARSLAQPAHDAFRAHVRTAQ